MLPAVDFDGLNIGLLILRVVTGLTFAAHGYSKIFMGGRLEGTAGWFDSMGMRPGWLHARLAAGTEIGSGLLLAAGFLMPFAGAGITGVMIVAAWTVHRPNGFFIVRNGWEYNLVLSVIGISLGAMGSGKWGIDYHLFNDNLVGWTGLLIALILGVGGGVGQLVMFFKPEVERA